MRRFSLSRSQVRRISGPWSTKSALAQTDYGQGRPNWLAIANSAGYATGRLAGLFGISTRQLERGFAQCGQPPQSWLDETRVWTGALQLAKGERPKCVSLALAFEDIGSFWRRFKIYFGITPRQYQQLRLTGMEERHQRPLATVDLSGLRRTIDPLAVLLALEAVPNRSEYLHARAVLLDRQPTLNECAEQTSRRAANERSAHPLQRVISAT